jgi:holo-[acyl-carrier protein] synthase
VPADTAVSVRGIGIDLVPIARMRQVMERWQERFVSRVFTPEEIAYCRSRKDPAPHFAARFAAKEAGLKALGTGLRLGVSWRELEVRRERGGPPVLVLRGRSREIARQRQGADRMLLALSHDGDYAIAQAMLVDDATTDHAPGAGA